MDPCRPVAAMGLRDESTLIDQPALVLTDTGMAGPCRTGSGAPEPSPAWPHGMAHGIRPGSGSPDADGTQPLLTIKAALLNAGLAVEESWVIVEVPDGLSPCPGYLNLIRYSAGRSQGDWFETILPTVWQTSFPILDRP